jgi:uridine kinase
VENLLLDIKVFSEALFNKMKSIDPAVQSMELYEFRYCLNNLEPVNGWKSVRLKQKAEIEKQITDRNFYSGVRIKEKVNDRIVLDEKIIGLTNMLFVGLVTSRYDEAWLKHHFYFDVRGFFFLHRTTYFSEEVLKHLGGKPFKQFEQRQKDFDGCQDISYKAFNEANREVDELFIESVRKYISYHGAPILMAVAGPTAAGKTEIVERLREILVKDGRKVTTIELDNFLTDRDYREAKGIYTEGRQAYHYELFTQSLRDITAGKKISIPRYDFVFATSSHDLDGNLKPDGVPVEVEPADIIFIEGNFPFLFEEVVNLIDLKVVYLTDDPIRLKRKWKRDIDYRKKYEPRYFCNRYFKDQFIMAEIAYCPQMAICDMVVDTTGAALWTTEQMAALLTGE